MTRSRPPKIADLRADLPPSRAQKKRELEKLRQLGITLVELPAGQYAKMDLPEDLRDAIDLARRLTDKNARRRQIQFIQAQIEQCDVAAIRASLEKVDRQNAAVGTPASPSPKSLLADELLAGNDDAIFALSDRFPPEELQRLRQAVRKAKKDLTAGKSADACRAAVVKTLNGLSG